MCIIAIKPTGMNLQSEEILKECFKSNPDGSGFMYNNGRKVVIKKGFMSYKDFKNAIDSVPDIISKTVVMHFRITTHGGTSQQNCHPFPLSKHKRDLTKLNATTNLGIAHNGIIPIDVKDSTISDTMEYIKTRLYKHYRWDKEFYFSSKTLCKIEKEINSKMVFLHPDGSFEKVGNFVEDEGYLYSNYSYVAQQTYVYNYNYQSKEVEQYSTPLGEYDYYKEDTRANLLTFQDTFYIDADGTCIYGDEYDIWVTEKNEFYIENCYGDLIRIYGHAYDYKFRPLHFSYDRDVYIVEVPDLDIPF